MRTYLHKIKYNHLVAILVSAFILCFLALYNRYPLTFNHDSGVYLENGFGGTVAYDRPILYGLFLYFSSLQQTLWFSVITQALIVSLIIYYYFRYFAPASNFIPFYLGFTLLISFFMGGSFNVSWLMPDVFTPVCVLCMGLLLANELKVRDNIIISSLLVLSIGIHNSHFYICMGLSLLLLIGFAFRSILKIYRVAGVRLKGIAFVMILIIAGNLFVGAVHYMFEGRFKSSRGGSIFIMSNLIEMGIIDRYLTESCKEKNYELCRYKDSLPNNFLWAENGPIYKTGGWEGNEKKYATIIKDMLMTPKYLRMFSYKSWVYTCKQFFNFDIVEVKVPSNRVNEAIAANYASAESLRHSRSKQSTDSISFGFINFAQNIVVAACLVIYSLVFIFNKMTVRYRFFIAFILLSLIANAWVCGTFSGVFPRYQIRVMWLLPLPLFLYLTEQFSQILIFKRFGTMPKPESVRNETV
ncbi:hypothetical protein FAM09_03645 [Niastella caeni]|uniref:Uncharacterized protein n=1 Tax=Niastella caeni TaxID=2569763 RepID=A0A4S8HZE0_9BACT|nr:hypothetical protein [Niastella caeni]THU41218.1 hypothetical protein FAM09_03645 [Niastella caeni]